MMEPTIERAVDLRRYARILRKRVWVVASCAVVVFTIIFLGTILQAPIYRSTANVLIEREAPNVLSFQEVVALGTRDYYDTTSYYETQFQIIKSRKVAGAVLRKLALDREAPFSTTADPIKAFLDRVAVDPVKNSWLVSVSFEDTDPARAARVANAIAEAYQEENLQAKLDASKTALDFLGRESREQKDKLQASEAALQQFKEKNGIVSFQDRQDIVGRRIAELTTAATDAQRVRSDAESLYKRVRGYAASPERSESIPAVLANELIQNLKAERIELERKQAEIAQRYLPKHPESVRLQAQRDLLDRELAAQIGKIVRGIEAEYAVAADREKALAGELDAVKQEKQALDKKEIEYRVLEREVETNRGLYDVLQKRMKETQVTENLRANNIRLIDRAEPPLAPVRPRTRVNLILGLILGLVGGAGLAFFFEFIDNTVKTQEDVEGLLRLPFLGIIPSFRGDVGERIATDLFAHEHPKSSVTESCRVIRTNLLFAAPDKTLRRLLVTSAGPQEGKSTTVTNLGIVLAQGGKRVLILDSDLRRPRLHKVFDVPAGRPGLTTLIMGEATLDEVIFATAVPGLSVIPCGPIPPTPSELLGSRHMEDLLPRLDERFDWVLFDSPPVIAVTDAVVLSRLADGVVLVVKAGKTTRDLVVRAKRQLDDVGAPILGTVLNDFNVLGDGYRYYYYYQAAREDAGGKRETRRRRGRPSAGEIPDA